MQLKDNNNQSVMPNTTAANVSYGNTNVAAKIAELEQAGGGSSVTPQYGINLFSVDNITDNLGVVYAHSGGIETDNLYKCAFVPLEFDAWYLMTGYDWTANGGMHHANIIALAKGTASSFTNLLVADFVSGAQWLADDAFFTHGTNLYLHECPGRFYFKTPKANELDGVTSIGLVINTTWSGTAAQVPTPCNDTLSVVRLKADGSMVGKTAAFFGASITEGTDGGYVKRTAELLQLGHVYNFGSSGANTERIWKIMLGLDDYPEKDYADFDAVIIKPGGNDRYHQAASFGDIEADIPDIGVYDILPTLEGGDDYSYNDNSKTIQSATVSTEKEFFTECFATTFYGYVASCIEYVRYINPNCRIFLQTEPHSVGIYTDFALLCEAIYAIAVKIGVQVIDGGAYAGLGLWNMSYWCKDTGENKIHFNVKGNEMWASYIANELDKKFYETEL